ncbi:MAG: YafY family transcriptional regulator, partial [Chloroflexota bacterium]|nr:YafY family transcriptional regulator [Chloroflexota bacterium]
MIQTSARLLRMLSLLQAHRDWAGKELAARLGVDARTIRRDVDRLRGLGYPVESTPGVAGGYRLAAGAHLPPLLLDNDEAVAVAVGLRTAASGSVAGIEEASVRALAKLEQMLPVELRRRVHAVQSYTVPLTVTTAAAVEPSLLAAIAAACRDTDRLKFIYQDRESATTTRIVEPLRLVCTGRRWYVLAWDVNREDWRTFRVDRIASLLASGPRFAPREPPEDVATYVSRAISSEPYRYQARVTLRAPAETVRARISPAAGLVRPLDEDTCMLETGADSLDALAMFVAMAGADFHVHEPPELAERIEELGRR